MARILVGICLMFVIASSLIYEAQGMFLLKRFLRKRFPRKTNEFTPFANKGMLMFVTDLESNCPPTTEFKTFFTQYKSYMNFIESASTTSQNVDAEMTAKCDGLFKAMSALSAGRGNKPADARSMKNTILSMGKTLIGMKKKTIVMSLRQKKELVLAMVKWTRMLATFIKSASAKKGKTIDISSYGLDVDVNDKSIIGESTERSSSTKTITGSNGGVYKDKTGENYPESLQAPRPSGSNSLSGSPTTSGSVGSSQSRTVTVDQMEAETSKNVMSFIMNLEKKCPQKEEYKGFFEKLKATMTFPSRASPRKRFGLFSRIKSAAGKISEAMAFIRSRIGGKSVEAKKSMENYQGQVVKTMEELDAIYSKIRSQNKRKTGGSLTLTPEQQKQIKVTIIKWEQVTTQFVQTAVRSETQSSSSSTSSSPLLGKLKPN